MQPLPFSDLISQETKRDPVAFAMRLREQGPLIPLSGFFGVERA